MLEAGTDTAGTSAFPVESVASIAEEGHPKGTHVASLKISDS